LAPFSAGFTPRDNRDFSFNLTQSGSDQCCPLLEFERFLVLAFFHKVFGVVLRTVFLIHKTSEIFWRLLKIFGAWV
jgi:hypothetical protein